MSFSVIITIIFSWAISGFATYGFTKGALVTSYGIDGWRYTWRDEFTCWLFALLPPPIGFLQVTAGNLLTPHRPRWHFTLKTPEELRSLDRPVWRSKWYSTDDSDAQKRADEHRQKMGQKNQRPPSWRLK